MLDPDLIQRSIVGKTFVSKFYYFDELASTNTYAKNLPDKDNVLVVADFQTDGKGRFDNSWESERGSNLTFSIKKNFSIEAKDISIVNYFYAYCIYDSLKSFMEHQKTTSNPVMIKWPNDILAGPKKLAGILVETNSKSREVVAGVGINVNQKTFRNEYSEKTTSLAKLTGLNVDLNNLLIKLVKDIDNKLHLLNKGNHDEIFERWLKGSMLAGKTVEFRNFAGKKFNGKVLGFLMDGGIKIAQEDKFKVFYSGDVRILNYN